MTLTPVSPCFSAGEAWGKSGSALPLEFSDSDDSNNDDQDEGPSDPDYEVAHDTDRKPKNLKGKEASSQRPDGKKKYTSYATSKEYNIEATFVQGVTKGHSLLKDPEGNLYIRNRKTGEKQVLALKNLSRCSFTTRHNYVFQRSVFKGAFSPSIFTRRR